MRRKAWGVCLRGGCTGVLLGLAAWSAAAGEGKVHAVQQTTSGRQVVLRADAPSVATVGSVRGLYVLHCAGCHGFDGKGTYSARVPGLHGLGHFLKAPGGRDYLLQVPGMMGTGLSDAQVAHMGNWLLGQWAGDSLPADHRPFEAEEVTRLRRQPLLDVATTRARLVQQVRAQGGSIAELP